MCTRHPVLIAAAALGVALSACGQAEPDPHTLLTSAKSLLDGATSAHFSLASSGAGGSGVVLMGGSGDIKRPDSFSGSLTVSLSGFTTTVAAVSVNGTFYVRNPLSNQFESADPAQYGFADPGRLMDPKSGLSSLLPECQNPATASDDRLDGALLHEVSCSLPGQDVKALLTDAAPQQPVAATVGIAADSGQLRRVALTGPFYSSSSSSTFTLVVTNYGENVTVTPPPAGS